MMRQVCHHVVLVIFVLSLGTAFAYAQDADAQIIKFLNAKVTVPDEYMVFDDLATAETAQLWFTNSATPSLEAMFASVNESKLPAGTVIFGLVDFSSLDDTTTELTAQDIGNQLTWVDHSFTSFPSKVAGHDATYYFIDHDLPFEAVAIGIEGDNPNEALGVGVWYALDVDFDAAVLPLLTTLVEELFGELETTEEPMITYTFDDETVYDFARLSLKVPVPDGYSVIEAADKRSVFMTNATGVDASNVLSAEVSNRLQTDESILGISLANGQMLVGDPNFTGTAQQFAEAIGVAYERRDGTATVEQMPDFGGKEVWTSYVDVPEGSPLAMDFTTVVFDFNSNGRLVLVMNAVTHAGGKVPNDLSPALNAYVAAFNAANFTTP